MPVIVGRADLTFAEVVAVARGGACVRLAPDAHERMACSHARVETAAGGDRPVYGITTGFGALANTRIPPAARSELQHALPRSHAAGMGPPVAHAALCLTGEGWVLDGDGGRMEAAAALRRVGLAPLQLQAKEGITLLHGTDGMLAMLVLACVDATRVCRTAG